MEAIEYPSLLEAERKLQACERAWWQHPVTIACLVMGLSCLDAVTLYTVVDTVMLESQFVVLFMVAGLSLALNFIPLIGGHFIRERYYGRSRVPDWSLVVLAATFFLLFSLSFYLRWETRELSLSATQPLLLDTTQSLPETSSGNVDSAQATALTLLLGTLPLVTSIVNLYLGFISEDPVKKRLNRLRVQRIELREMLSDLKAALDEMNEDRIQPVMDLEEERYVCAREKVFARCGELMDFARFLLAEHLRKADHISKLTEEQRLHAA